MFLFIIIDIVNYFFFLPNQPFEHWNRMQEASLKNLLQTLKKVIYFNLFLKPASPRLEMEAEAFKKWSSHIKKKKLMCFHYFFKSIAS